MHTVDADTMPHASPHTATHWRELTFLPPGLDVALMRLRVVATT